MSSCPSPAAPRLDRFDLDAFDLDAVEQIARSMAMIHHDDPDAPPFAFYCEPGAEEVEIGIRPLETDPASALVGFTAPAGWLCLGTAATGRAHRVVSEPPAGYRFGVTDLEDPDGPGRAACLVNVVSRDGASLAVVHLDGEDDPHVLRDELPAGSLGRIDDALRLALGLATPPPAQGTIALFAAVWLDRIVERSLTDPHAPDTWDAVAALHPVFDPEIGVTDLRPLTDWVRSNLSRAGELLAEVRTWEYLLAAEQASDTEWGEDLAWLDVGAYSRLRLSTYPEVDDLLVDLEALLPPRVSQRVRACLDRWGLVPT